MAVFTPMACAAMAVHTLDGIRRGFTALDDLVDKGFDTLIHHNDTAVKIIVHP